MTPEVRLELAIVPDTFRDANITSPILMGCGSEVVKLLAESLDQAFPCATRKIMSSIAIICGTPHTNRKRLSICQYSPEPGAAPQ